jgi:hypothetical protein
MRVLNLPSSHCSIALDVSSLRFIHPLTCSKFLSAIALTLLRIIIVEDRAEKEMTDVIRRDYASKIVPGDFE